MATGVMYDTPESIEVVVDTIIERINKIERRLDQLEYGMNVKGAMNAKTASELRMEQEMIKVLEDAAAKLASPPTPIPQPLTSYMGMKIVDVDRDIAKHGYHIKTDDGNVHFVTDRAMQHIGALS